MKAGGQWSVTKLRQWLGSHLVLVLILVTLCALVLFPIADCFDCQFPSPWGRNDAIYEIRSIVFDCWLFGASFLLGVLKKRWGWLVPIAIALIACATEPLGGVPLWSLLGNEWPEMLIFGGFVGLTSFVIGAALRVPIDYFVSRRSRATRS
jgi:hypothetical protein